MTDHPKPLSEEELRELVRAFEELRHATWPDVHADMWNLLVPQFDGLVTTIRAREADLREARLTIEELLDRIDAVPEGAWIGWRDWKSVTHLVASMARVWLLKSARTAPGHPSEEK